MLTNYNVSSAKELRKSLNINFSPLKSLSTDACVIGTAKTIHASRENILLSCSAQYMHNLLLYNSSSQRLVFQQRLVLRIKVSCSQHWWIHK